MKTHIDNGFREQPTLPCEPVAIIGMSCRFAQAHTLDDFWSLLHEAKDTVAEIPAERWNVDEYYDANAAATRKTNQRHASLLKGIHDFDPFFFGISPAEAAEMNPSQKLMLELVWEAIENSTIPFNHVQGRKIGVYVGNIWSDFEHLRKHKNAAVTSHSAMGQSANIIANRVSFVYGFTGPSLVVDTGCSSSLVALHLACQSLWDGSTEMSFAAGINHILDPDQYVLLTKFGGLSTKGRCSTFDTDADGFVRGEGGGVVFLKKLSQAEKDGDKIYAVIRGTAVNNNGYNVNLPATSVNGQKQVLEDAYRNSGIEPYEVHYVEAHGTGTRLGDPTEARALGEFFGAGRTHRLHIGSVKTNIGHQEAAAGIAGLIKVVLSMQNRLLPPNLHYKTPNPTIPLDELKLKVQDTTSVWPVRGNESLKAGINSFGWGGTNAHTVIEEYKVPENAVRRIPEVSRYCLPLSAKSGAALRDYVKAYIHRFNNAPADAFGDICAATALLKPSFEHRVLFSAAHKSEMLHALEGFLAESEEVAPYTPFPGKDKVVMIFPGQGSQWPGMGSMLLQKEPVFRHTIEACHEAFKCYTDWSLTDQLKAGGKESRFHEIDVVQPALFAVQVALAKLWMSWGIRPDVVVGHSMGEVAAAHIAGALDLDDAARIICTRSKLMKTVSGKGGAMVVTELSLADAAALLQRYPSLSVAVNNSPKSTVLAGDQPAIEKVIAELEQQQLFCRQVKVDVASHSQQMDPLKEDLYQALQPVKPVPATIPIYSTARNKMVAGEDFHAGYWVDNLRNSVQFASAMEHLMMMEHGVFIEVSPHPVLLNAVNECAEHARKTIVTVASLYREKPEQESIFKNLGDLYSRGYDIPWHTFYQSHKAPVVQLPHYPFQRETYEMEDRSHELEDRKSNTRFPLLGTALHLAGSATTTYWETRISLASFPYLQDHLVNDTVVLPGAAYVEMVLEAAHEMHGDGIPVIEHIRFIRSVSMTAEESHTIQLKLHQHDKVSRFEFFTKVVSASGKIMWELLAEGNLKIRPRNAAYEKPRAAAGHTDPIPASVYYESLSSLGLKYGPHFQALKELRKGSGPQEQVYFTLAAGDGMRSAANRYRVHPALLDACFQPLFCQVVAGAYTQDSCTTFLTDIGEVQLLEPFDPSLELEGIAVLHPLKEDRQRGFINVGADISVYTTTGLCVMKVKALKGRIINTASIAQRKAQLKNWLYKVNWVKLEEAAPYKSVVPTGDTWVVLGDPYGVSGIIVEKMLQQGLTCIHVTPGPAFTRINNNQYSIHYGCASDYSLLLHELLMDGNRKITGILHAGSMSYTWQDPYLTADVVEAQQVYGSISFMFLHQQLSALNLTVVPKLIIVTNGIHPVGQEAVVQPVHSPLWGIAKVMFNELTHFKSRYFDLSANPSSEELDQVVAAIQLSAKPENEIAFRGRDQYVPRLQEHTEEHHDWEEKERFSPEGTYLVTGFGGLGFVFIEWMIRQGARNFALVSRSGRTSEDVSEKITLLTAQGCRFEVFNADTGNYSELKVVLDEIGSTMPALKGVIHAAGVIEAKALVDINPGEFLRILNPKVKGAWNLHLLTQDKPLDCFIMFSSASTLIGLSGQGSYVAANAFLDSLAHSRRRMGLPGVSINWGVMRDVGMVATRSALEKYARAEGFEPVSMKDALEVLNIVYNRNHPQIGIVRFNAESMASYYSALRQTPYFSGLLNKESHQKTGEGNFSEYYLSLTAAEERKAALEQLVTKHVATIIKTSTARIKGTMTFKGLGIDSLMAIQLRNLLEKSLQVKLSVAMFWAHPSISEYSSFLSHAVAEQGMVQKTETAAIARTPRVKSPGWFVIPQRNPEATLRLFCFHDAGGNASLFQGWENQLGDEIELVAVELPGRRGRILEDPYINLDSLVLDLSTALVPFMDKPAFFFGHSMGGLIAFELIRALRKENVPLPAKLFISSTPGLTMYKQHDVDPTRTDEELLQMFPQFGEARIRDGELQQLLLNLLRADLQLINRYRYTQETRLNIPLVVIYGNDDPRVRKNQVERWKEETISSCKLIARPGGHRYIEEDTTFLTELIREEADIHTRVAQV